ncbi:hypothetical protein [Novosphingobium sp.]|uniref:hypothetical protein n=1 Tax=Novosphingobium sp. TaxID=1874826 RepID=UPI0035AD953C
MSLRALFLPLALLIAAPACADPVAPQAEVADDPAAPLIDALRDVSASLRASPYATSSEVARQNTDRYLAGLFGQAWDFAGQLGTIGTPSFGRSTGVEGLPGLFNPDNIYRSVLLEPGGMYRIYGRRGTHDELSFQVVDKYPIVGLGKNLLVIRPNAKQGKDFEVFLGGAPRKSGNWFALPDQARAVLARQSFGDWRQSPSTLFVERLDQPPPRERSGRFVEAANALRQAARLWVETYVPGIERATWVNELPKPRLSDTSTGGLGNQMSVMARYRIAQDEALVITVRKADVAYQGIQLGDPWFVTPNPVLHQVSLTARQARVDADGMIRFVIALGDPGVPNWLDPAGNPEGYVFMRWQGIRAPLGPDAAPTAQRVPLARLRQLLPATTPQVDAATRAAQLAERKWVPQIR